MNANFDKQTFGQQVEVVRPALESIQAICSDQLSSFINAQLPIHNNFGNSSSMRINSGRFSRSKRDSRTNCSDTRSLMCSGSQTLNTTLARSMENQTISQVGAKQLLHEMRQLNGLDNFYCSCDEQEKQNFQACKTCQGEGAISGNTNLVKFMEYVIEFKLGLRQTYKIPEPQINGTKNQQHQQQQQQQKQRVEEISSSKSIKLEESSFLEKSKKKRFINLTFKPQTKIPNDSGNRINQFCCEFIKSQTSQSSSFSPLSIYSNLEGVENKTSKMQNVVKQSQSTQYLRGNYQSGGQNRVSGKNSVVEIGNLQKMRQTISKCDFDFRQKIQLNNSNLLENNTTSFIGLDRTELYCGTNSKPLKNQPFKSPPARDFTSFYTKSMNVQISRSSYGTQNCGRLSMQAESLRELRQKVCPQKMIHRDFSCNICNISDIMGIRYHCSSLMCNDDYDLCEDCYKEHSHKHKMEPILGNWQRILQKMQNANISLCTSVTTSSRSQNIQSSNRLSVGTNIQRITSSTQNIFKSSIH